MDPYNPTAPSFIFRYSPQAVEQQDKDLGVHRSQKPRDRPRAIERIASAIIAALGIASTIAGTVLIIKAALMYNKALKQGYSVKPLPAPVMRNGSIGIGLAGGGLVVFCAPILYIALRALNLKRAHKAYTQLERDERQRAYDVSGPSAKTAILEFVTFNAKEADINLPDIDLFQDITINKEGDKNNYSSTTVVGSRLAYQSYKDSLRTSMEQVIKELHGEGFSTDQIAAVTGISEADINKLVTEPKSNILDLKLVVTTNDSEEISMEFAVVECIALPPIN